jgi:predicted double-glycine peptidase
MRQLAAVAFAVLAGLVPLAPALAGGAAHVYGEAGGAYTVPLRTVKALRLARAFRTTMRQQHDFSCGSAAVATLLTYHYDRPVTEAQVFQAMYAQGDRAKIERYGFSLLDMKRYLESRGYQADGFEVTLDKLAEARVPAIALVREHGYNHFVVIKGLRSDRILIGDPSSGTRDMTRAEFGHIWHGGILFVIRSHTELARFDVPDHWRVQLPGPLSAEGMNRNGLASPTLMMRGPNDF